MTTGKSKGASPITTSPFLVPYLVTITMAFGRVGANLKCRNCQKLFSICGGCYRNNKYCSKKCREFSRAKYQKLASQRYSKSHIGKKKCAARVGRFRARARMDFNKKVTHQTTPAYCENVQGNGCNFSPSPTPDFNKVPDQQSSWCCIVCKLKIERFLRGLTHRSLRHDYQRGNYRNAVTRLRFAFLDTYF